MTEAEELRDLADYSVWDKVSTEVTDATVVGGLQVEQKPEPPPLAHLGHPIVLNPDGTTKKAPLHQFRGLNVKRIIDLIGGPFLFNRTVEVDGVGYGIAYLAQPDVGCIEVNLLVAMMVQTEIYGKAMLISDGHASFEQLTAYSGENEHRLNAAQEELKKLQEAEDGE
jgi:hypothetical protein